LTGKTFSSNVERSNHLKQILDEHGEEINILPLQGFIFFGTANRLLQKVQERLNQQELAELKYLVFDFRQVTGLDSSALNSLNKLQIMAENFRFKVLLCGLKTMMKSQMNIEGLISDDNTFILVFDDLDHGLEWCEEQIINNALPDVSDVARSDERDSFKHKFHQIAEYFETNNISAGTTIIKQGENPGGITFIESGQITVELKTDTEKIIRLKTLGPGTVIGEVSLYLGTKASASVVANSECNVFFLTQENFNKMNLDSPEKAAELHSYIVELLSDRLADSNATIQALMR
jgi:SulP family sulfate permease